MRKQYSNLHSYIRAEVVPEMQIKLRQGFGRAIRTETDSCVVAILDLARHRESDTIRPFWMPYH